MPWQSSVRSDALAVVPRVHTVRPPFSVHFCHTGRHWTMVVKDPLLVTAKKLEDGLDLSPGW